MPTTIHAFLICAAVQKGVLTASSAIVLTTGPSAITVAGVLLWGLAPG